MVGCGDTLAVRHAVFVVAGRSGKYNTWTDGPMKMVHPTSAAGDPNMEDVIVGAELHRVCVTLSVSAAGVYIGAVTD